MTRRDTDGQRRCPPATRRTSSPGRITGPDGTIRQVRGYLTADTRAVVNRAPFTDRRARRPSALLAHCLYVRVGMPAASASRAVWLGAGRPSADERHTDLGPGCHHLGVAAEPGRAPVKTPVRRVRFHLPTPRPPAGLGHHIRTRRARPADQHGRAVTPHLRQPVSHRPSVGPGSRASHQHPPAGHQVTSITSATVPATRHSALRSR